MITLVDWWCPVCFDVASFRGTGKFQFGHCKACRCQWLMFVSSRIGPTSATDPDFLEAFVPGYRLVARRPGDIRPPSEWAAIWPLSELYRVLVLGLPCNPSGGVTKLSRQQIRSLCNHPNKLFRTCARGYAQQLPGYKGRLVRSWVA